MKTIFKHRLVIMALTFIFSSSFNSSLKAQNNPDNPVTYQTFYNDLSPYGTWIEYPNYGHVWNPNVGSNFRPYQTNGHWASTSDGWAWESNYSWGWAPFHYGSWLYDDMYGWLWVPGYDWSPAWVTWGFVDNYYCWAPIIPGLDLRLGYSSWRPNSFYWNACRREHIYDRNLSRVMERPAHFANFQNRISIINNYDKTRGNHFSYSKGPDVREVEKFTNTKINQNSFRDVKHFDKTNHKGNEMRVYRPNIQNPQETPNQNFRPDVFRKATANLSRPINQEGQKPMLHSNEQRANIERLPLNNFGARNNGNDHSQRQNNRRR